MQNEHKFALMFARLVDLLRQSTGGTNERRAALQALIDQVNMRSATVRFEDGVLSVEGITAPQDVPFVKTFVKQLKAHDVSEIRIAHRAAQIDVMETILALAADPGEEPIATRLMNADVATVDVVSGARADLVHHRRRERVSDAILGISKSAAMPDEEGKPEVLEGFQGEGELPPDFVPAQAGAAYGQMVELREASSSTLAAAVRRLRGLHDDAHELSKGLNAVAAAVVTAVRESRVPEAIDAIIAVIRQEREEHREEVQLRYGVALRRILQPEVLQPLKEYLIDPLYDKDVGEIMRRAGSKGTEMLLTELVSATTFAERRAYLEALRQVDTGMDMVVKMLHHHEWFVVRNVADLVGELRIEEAVPGLGEAVTHDDMRVRLSAGLALAKIGTPSAVKHLGTLLRDDQSKIRLEVVKAVTGRGLGALAMPLVNAADTEEEEAVRLEMYRALGRIGSNDAVQALIKVAKPKGLLTRLPGMKTDPGRLAATEGLGLAGGSLATPALQQLADDRDKKVREMALKGLELIKERRRAEKRQDSESAAEGGG